MVRRARRGWYYPLVNGARAIPVEIPADLLDVAQTVPLPEYSSDGVDLSLIRWFIAMTPAERLAFAEDRVNDILRIRALNAGK